MELKVLAIGNSFSQDAAKYLHQIAASDGVELKMLNLYIGGCSLEHHMENVKGDIADYDHELNGNPGDRKISIDEALAEDNWDIITMQQVSGSSGQLETYFPYITDLYNHVKEKCPRAKYYIHQTWAYEKGSSHPDFPNYNCDREKMHNDLVAAYANVAKELGGLKIIPCGEAMMNASKNQVFDTVMGDKNPFSLHRDGFHASYVLGRYLLGATWYETLTGNSMENNKYVPLGFDKSAMPLIKKAVHDAVEKYR